MVAAAVDLDVGLVVDLGIRHSVEGLGGDRQSAGAAGAVVAAATAAGDGGKAGVVRCHYYKAVRSEVVAGSGDGRSLAETST